MPMDKINVFLVDDHQVVRDGIRMLLEKDPEIVCIGESLNGEDAIVEVEKLQPDVVLMDITMPGLNGLEATRIIKEKCPKVKVLILTMHETGQYLSEMLQAGASGYVVKTSSTDDLISAIRTVLPSVSPLFPGALLRCLAFRPGR